MSRFTYPWLMTLLAIPAVVALIGSFGIDAERLRRIALAASCLLFVLCVAVLWAVPAFGQAGWTDPWDPMLLILGTPVFRIDQLSSLLLPFTALLWILAVGVTPRRSLDRDGIRRTALATAATLGIFLTESPALIAVLWASSILILLRGLAAGGYLRALRIAAVYLGLSTLLLVVGLLAAGLPMGESLVSWPASVCVLLAVMIRKGIFPVHGWLPETFEHGRIGPAVLFSAPQVGAYVAITLFVPRASAGLLTIAALLALGTAVYGAVAAMTQRDARRAFGYLFISQSALVLAGLECVSVEGLTGGLALWLSSGIAFATLARCLAVLEARRGRLSLDRFNGGYERMPLLASSFLLTALAAVGFPGTLGFIGHELLVTGTVAQYPRTGFLVVVATALGGIALIRIYFALFCGRLDPGAHLGLRTREVVLFASFSGLLLAAGLAPRLIVDSREMAATNILARRRSALQLLEDLPRRVGAGAARDAAAGVCAATAEIQPLERGPVSRPPEQGTHREELVERLLAVEDVAAAQAECRLDVRRSENLPMHDERTEIRGKFNEGLLDALRQPLARGVPITPFQLVGRVLDVDRHHVSALGSERRIGDGRYGHVEDGARREPSVLGRVEGALQVIDLGADVYAAPEKIGALRAPWGP